MMTSAPGSTPTCSWQLRLCPDASACLTLGCFSQCPNGFVKDQYGCDTCQCADAGTTDPCAGKKCGDSCSKCVPNQPCPAIAAFCDGIGVCGGHAACVADAGPASDAGACCPANWDLYGCTLADGTAGEACHNPALGCASSSTCGVGCDAVVTGRCGP